MPNFNREAKIAEKVIKKSSKILMEYFSQEKKLVRHSKIGSDFATDADFAAEKLIIAAISKHFPGHNIHAEETGNQNRESDYLWLIDPLDGTLNFASGLPVWASMLALQHKNKIVLSVISIPVLKELCIARKNKGTYLNGEKIRMLDKEKLDSWIYFCGIANYNKPSTKRLFENTFSLTRDISMIGSVGAGGVFLATNRINAIIADWMNPLDMAPPYLIIKEAGGSVTDLEGNPWLLNSKNFVAAGSKIHSSLLEKIK